MLSSIDRPQFLRGLLALNVTPIVVQEAWTVSWKFLLLAPPFLNSSWSSHFLFVALGYGTKPSPDERPDDDQKRHTTIIPTGDPRESPYSDDERKVEKAEPKKEEKKDKVSARTIVIFLLKAIFTCIRLFLF